jgi:hypothetical protein
MARCVDRFQRPAGAAEVVAVFQPDVGAEVQVVAGLHPHLPVRGDAGFGAGVHPGAGQLGQRAGERRVVHVRMSDEDVGDALAGGRGQDRVPVLAEIRTGVDDRDIAVADDVGPRAVEGERAGVAGDDAADQRADLLHDAVLELHLTNEGDHGSGLQHESAERP